MDIDLTWLIGFRAGLRGDPGYDIDLCAGVHLADYSCLVFCEMDLL